MVQTDVIRTALRFLPATRKLALGVGSGLLALFFFFRATQNADAFGQTVDQVLGAIAGLVALWKIGQGVWSVLVIKQQERVPVALQNARPAPGAKIEDPDEAVRRMWGKP